MLSTVHVQLKDLLSMSLATLESSTCVYYSRGGG